MFHYFPIQSFTYKVLNQNLKGIRQLPKSIWFDQFDNNKNYTATQTSTMYLRPLSVTQQNSNELYKVSMISKQYKLASSEEKLITAIQTTFTPNEHSYSLMNSLEEENINKTFVETFLFQSTSMNNSSFQLEYSHFWKNISNEMHHHIEKSLVFYYSHLEKETPPHVMLFPIPALKIPRINLNHYSCC